MLKFKKSWFLMTATLAVILGEAPRADAAFAIRFSDGANERIVYDNGADDSSDASGEILFSGKVGNFQIKVSYGTSNAPGGEMAIVEIGTSSIQNKNYLSGGDHTLSIEVSSQDFDSPQSPPPLTVFSTTSGSVATGTLTSATFTSYTDKSNALWGQGFATDTLTFTDIVGPSSSFSGDAQRTGFEPNGDVYSVTNVGTYTLSAGAKITLTGGNTVVMTPEPSTAVLTACAMPLILGGIFFRRRTRKA
ncbi:MAG: hypothetical protein L0Y71_10705 [Gemmataceae bacterium]|nr:hypothetical protein [Gemmataceae bacterium]